MFSIFILTHNEELDIADCIASAALCDDVIVVDSFSSDRTVDIATEMIERYPQLRIVQHAFESHGRQRTWMLRNVASKYDWAYILEADERMTPALFSECSAVIAAGDHAGYYAAERMMFMHKWIRYSTQYPRYQLRLLDKQRVWFDDYGHTEREVIEGSHGFLKETYPHYTCSKGFSRWIEKHNRYSTDEARETVKQLADGHIAWRALLGGKSEVDRRRALKDLSLRVPFRPLVRFVYMYFFLGGVLDGRAGFTWCVLQAFYEYLILLKVWEIRQAPLAPTSATRMTAEPVDVPKEQVGS